jgi:hypothetical protein
MSQFCRLSADEFGRAGGGSVFFCAETCLSCIAIPTTETKDVQKRTGSQAVMSLSRASLPLWWVDRNGATRASVPSISSGKGSIVPVLAVHLLATRSYTRTYTPRQLGAWNRMSSSCTAKPSSPMPGTAVQ